MCTVLGAPSLVPMQSWDEASVHCPGCTFTVSYARMYREVYDRVLVSPAVSGCSDSSPRRTTADCHYAAETKLSLHGLNFDLFCSSPGMAAGYANSRAHAPRSITVNTEFCTLNFRKFYSIYVGPYKCRDPVILSKFVISCTIDKGAGAHLTVAIKMDSDQQQMQQSNGWTTAEGIVAALEGALSFKEAVNFREKFSKFVELGVGGLKREIDELYRRAFASRGIDAHCRERSVAQRVVHASSQLRDGMFHHPALIAFFFLDVEGKLHFCLASFPVPRPAGHGTGNKAIFCYCACTSYRSMYNVLSLSIKTGRTVYNARSILDIQCLTCILRLSLTQASGMYMQHIFSCVVGCTHTQ